MSEDVNARSPSRPYRAPQREATALATRLAILSAARDLFTTQGYAHTSVAAIAARAGVAVDTVYAAVGLLAVHQFGYPTLLVPLAKTQKCIAG